MLNSHVSHIEIIGYLMAAGKLPAALAVLSRLYILVRDKMVHNQGNLILIKYGLSVHLLHLVNGNRRSDVISQH